MYKPNDAYYKEFTTANPSTGAAANADSLPAATANHNGTDDSSFSLTVANLDAGRYKITGTVPSGYAPGDVVNVSVAATCSGVAGKAVVDTFTVDTKRVGDLHDFNYATQGVTVGGYATNEDPATLVLGAAAGTFATPGTVGAKINSAASSGDPWTTALPGSYSAGQAGYIVGHNLDGTISGISTKLGTPAGASVSADIANVPAATLKADWTTVSGEAKFSLLNALRTIRNRLSISGTTVTVYKEDGATPAFTNTLTATPGATPITGSTPN